MEVTSPSTTYKSNYGRDECRVVKLILFVPAHWNVFNMKEIILCCMAGLASA